MNQCVSIFLNAYSQNSLTRIGVFLAPQKRRVTDMRLLNSIIGNGVWGQWGKDSIYRRKEQYFSDETMSQTMPIYVIMRNG